MTHRWTPEHDELLAGMAGFHGAREIAAALGHSVDVVRARAATLGIALPEPPGAWCVRCARWRTRLRGDGRCRVCAARDAAEAAEAEHGAADVPPPRPAWSRPGGTTERERIATVEADEVAYWRRRAKAAQKRGERERDG